MTCMATRLFCRQLVQNQSLKQFVKNVSISTNFLPLHYKEGPRNHNIYQYQTKRYSNCRRVNPCIKKKQEEAEKKLKEAKNPKTFWQSLFERKTEKKKPPIQTCRRLQKLKKWEVEPIPEFIIEMCKDLPKGSCIYKTKGHAFILEVPCKRVVEKKKTRSEIQLAKIERDKQCLNLEDENNPMPNYNSCGQRLLDLTDRKLHPLYKKLEMPQTNRPTAYKLVTKYRCVAEELASSEQSKITTWDLYHKRKKTSFADFKMCALPRYLEMKEMAYKINTCSNLEYRKEVLKKCKDGKNHFKINPATSCGDIDCERWTNQKPRKPKRIF